MLGTEGAAVNIVAVTPIILIVTMKIINHWCTGICPGPLSEL